RKGFEQLMSYPFGGRILRDRNVHGPTPIMRQNHEDEQHPEKRCWDHEEIRRNQVLGMIGEECAPRLRGRSPMADHGLRDRRLSKLESELLESPMNARRAPSRVGEAHSVNQFENSPRHGRPALGMATLPPPIESESSPMPCDHCFRLDDRKGRTPATPEL